jgi:hypothetical protein
MATDGNKTMDSELDVEKVTAEWISEQRVDDTGSVDLLRILAAAGLPLIAGAIMAMGLGMHLLTGY